jgi:hypothetical protein
LLKEEEETDLGELGKGGELRGGGIRERCRNIDLHLPTKSDGEHRVEEKDEEEVVFAVVTSSRSTDAKGLKRTTIVIAIIDTALHRSLSPSHFLPHFFIACRVSGPHSAFSSRSGTTETR